ncbi:MAG: hypothetical protein JWR49_1373, partial [Tardiphaga sp.]|nr:hypothetical protein [Tardiphaga sp.]
MTSFKIITCAAGLVLGFGAHVAAAAEAFTQSSTT